MEERLLSELASLSNLANVIYFIARKEKEYPGKHGSQNYLL